VNASGPTIDHTRLAVTESPLPENLSRECRELKHHEPQSSPQPWQTTRDPMHKDTKHSYAGAHMRQGPVDVFPDSIFVRTEKSRPTSSAVQSKEIVLAVPWSLAPIDDLLLPLGEL
jgi:hypothetical protein